MPLSDRFSGNPLLKGMIVLMSGTILAQIISFLASLVLSRLYDPADFGLLSIFTAIASAITVLASGKYELGFMVAKNMQAIHRILRLAFYLVLTTATITLLITIGIYLFPFSSALNPSIRIWNLALGLAVFLVTMGQVYTMFLAREKSFGNLSSVRIVESISNNGAAMLFYSFGAPGLLFAYLFSQFSVYIGLHLFAFRKLKPFKYYFDAKELKSTASEFSEYPRFNILQGMSDLFQMQGVILVGASFLPLPVMGFYSIAMRILQVPVWLIIRPLAQVFFAEASQLYREGKSFYPLAKKVFFRSALFGLPVVVVLVFFGPFLFATLFGEKWRVAGELARVLSFWIYTDFIRSPLSQIPIIIGKQKKLLLFSLPGTIAFFTSIVVGGMLFPDNILYCFCIISGVQMLNNIIIISLCMLMAKSK